MRRFFSSLFGVFGISITCIQGIEPFIELSRWVLWFTANWIDFSRLFWSKLLWWFPLDVPEYVADALNAVLYTVALFWGYRRSDLWLTRLLFKLELCIRKFRAYGRQKIPQFLNRFLVNIAGIVFAIPMLIVVSILAESSLIQAAVFVLTALFAMIGPFWFPKSLPKFFNWLGTGKVEGSASSSYKLAGTVYFVMPIYIILFLTSLFIINEIAVNGENLLGVYKQARCDAGIEC